MNRTALLLTAASLGLPSAAAAQPVFLDFTARITEVDDPGAILGGALQVDDTITGQYSYDLSTLDTNPSPTVGDYWHNGGPHGISVQAGGLHFASDAFAPQFLVEIADDHGVPASDSYLLRSYVNNFLPNGARVDHIAWALEDPTLAALDGVALPAGAPQLLDWQSPFGLTLEGCFEDAYGACLPDPFFVRAHVETVRVTPGVVLQLTHTPLAVAQSVNFIVENAAPGSTVRFANADDRGAGPCPPLLQGLCADIVPPLRVLGSAVADGNGLAVLTRTVPQGAPLQTVHTQAVAPGAKSNVVTSDIAP